MRIAMYQPQTLASVQDAVVAIGGFAQAATVQGCDLLMLPELFLGGYLLQNVAARAIFRTGPELLRVAEAARRHSVAICVGYAERSADASGVLHNSAIVFNSAGEAVAHYRKTHLFGGEKRVFAPGDRLGDCFVVGGVRASLLICYDLEFPEAARQCALNGAELLLVPTASSGEPNTIIVRCRALENHVTVCYCNWPEFASAEGIAFNGQSLLAGPSGREIVAFQPGQEGLKVGEVPAAAAAAASGAGTGGAGADDYLCDRRPELYRLGGSPGMSYGMPQSPAEE